MFDFVGLYLSCLNNGFIVSQQKFDFSFEVEQKNFPISIYSYLQRASPACSASFRPSQHM